MSTVWVRFKDQRDYPIYIQTGLLARVGALTKSRIKSRRAFLLTHPRLDRLYGGQVAASLEQAGFRVTRVRVPEGEAVKSLDQVQSVIGQMLQAGADRTAFMAALGGGVIGDLAGFVAAVFMRGIPFMQIPTTLLAQVDSSVGGKVAVNHPQGKNLIGSFLQPRLVVADPAVLNSLPARQLRSGLAEVIKTAIIADQKFFLELVREMPRILMKDTGVLTRVIARSVAFKARIVEQDETEQGLRALLNYGHTVGHALEAYHGFKGYTHGEAVAIGMAAAAFLAQELGLCRPETAARQVELIRLAGLPVKGSGESVRKIWQLMQRDKKAKHGDLNFILTPSVGNARIFKKIPPFSVRRALAAILDRA